MSDLARAAPGAHARLPFLRPAPYAAPLVTTFLLRAGVNGAFAVWLFTRDPSWIETFQAGTVYGLVDGALGVLTGILLGRRRPVGAPPLLIAMVMMDAILRISAALAIRAFPGIPDFPITIVLFFGALGAWALIAGAAAMVAWFVAHEVHRDVAGRAYSRIRALFDPLSVAGVVAFVVAVYALVLGPPAGAADLRSTVIAVTGALTLVFLAASFSAATLGRAQGAN
ncbi:MAG: hypothetical protein WD801_16600 [Gemmatimonadaceae bacterium]